MISITPWTHNFAMAGLAIASLLDYLIGDPWNWLHPVQVIGWMISRYTHFVLKRLESPLSLRIAGVILGLGMIGGSGVAGWLIVQVTGLIHWGGAIAVSSILLASCFAGRSLRTAAEDVLKPLNAGDLATARSKLSLYVGRDTAQLTEPEILRAVFETVTENATDGVMAPLFWAIAGAFTPIGSVPFALAYKAASTLDSMVGYREAPYTHLGWFSARLEDYLTWIPCRLTVLTLSLLSGKPKYVWQICRRDAPQDPSPNAGWSECAYAAVVGVQVGGVNVYKGTVKHKPLLGDSIHPITPARIEQAMGLTRWMFLIWVAIAILTLWLS
ncbi:cobalamin biosynthesis protein [Leptolyngbya sp. FACHB-671]|uniref:adenosylcobinamide-phosphate synthase CbiB n=1 Tax=Leptolyngbya sp. FACHB-671 TaxID=2692812 RepID=UPI0016840B0B|nr:adenosylcobinamide-phosphate synthase CbiB [Leptolyngbya sp. FACHB-671]MBD2070516.1 cobalamin biosynthesis protein [Leptolyngbya sp. FACHB-671]